jgi:signal transduction histidine kinase
MGLVAPVWIDLEQAVAKAAAAPRAEGIVVSVDVAGLEMLADPLVEKVFLNLVDNSMRHGGRVTTITVTARAVDHGLVLAFEDDGVGIPEHEKELIFQAGYGKHTGYGLFLAREILVASGMSIVETGRAGSGARFEIAVTSGRFRPAATAG